jgi:Predicted Zn-dependent peptidases
MVLSVDCTVLVVVVNMMVCVGSCYEMCGRIGFAHFFEHFMFMGIECVFLGVFDVWMEVEGGWNNVWTSNTVQSTLSTTMNPFENTYFSKWIASSSTTTASYSANTDPTSGTTRNKITKMRPTSTTKKRDIRGRIDRYITRYKNLTQPNTLTAKQNLATRAQTQFDHQSLNTRHTTSTPRIDTTKTITKKTTKPTRSTKKPLTEPAPIATKLMNTITMTKYETLWTPSQHRKMNTMKTTVPTPTTNCSMTTIAMIHSKLDFTTTSNT